MQKIESLKIKTIRTEILSRELTEALTDIHKEHKKRSLIVEQLIQVEHIKKYFYSIVDKEKLNIILTLEKVISCRSLRDLARKMGIKNTNTRKMYNLRKYLFFLRDAGIIYFEDYIKGSKENSLIKIANSEIKSGKRIFIKNIRLTEWARGTLPFTKLMAL